MTELSTPIRGDADEATPEYAARLGLVSASAGFRALAFTIDAALFLLLASPIAIGTFMLVSGADTVLSVVVLVAGIVLATVFGILQLVLHGRRGVTAGKGAMRLRSVSVVDYGRPGFWRIVLRALVLWASGLLPVIGPAFVFASGLWDPQARGRSILDRVGGCWLVDCRAGIDPFDAKALRHARRALRGRPDDTEDLPSMATGAAERSALRIPAARSRAGVVGPGSTGAQWAQEAGDAVVIDDVPGAAAASAAPAALVDAVPRTTTSAPAPVAAPAPVPAPVPAPAVASPAAPPTRRAQAMLRFDDGSIVRVPALALLGRDPEAAAGEAVDALLRLEDPEKLMSKTHAAFGQDAEGVWVTDRDSRNGTELRSPEGVTVQVPAGERMRMPLGWTAYVGGRSFELVARGADS